MPGLLADLEAPARAADLGGIVQRQVSMGLRRLGGETFVELIVW